MTEPPRRSGAASPVGGTGEAAARSGRRDRAATVAALAEAIAGIGPTGKAGRADSHAVADSQADTNSQARANSHAGTNPRAGTDRPEAGRQQTGRRQAGRRGGDRHGAAPPPEDPTGPSGDAPGDPESVAKAICLRQLTARARSRTELAEALRRREIPADVAERVLDRFTEVGLIDDVAYAQAFVANKHRDRGLGRAALRTELRRKGIDGAAADRALQAVDADAERRRAAELVAKRLDSAIFAGLPAARRRLLGLLARRGYSASLAASVVDDALRGYVEPVELGPEDDAVEAVWDEPGI